MLAIAVLSFVIKPGVKSPEMAEGLELLEEEESIIEDEPRNGEVDGRSLETRGSGAPPISPTHLRPSPSETRRVSRTTPGVQFSS